MSLAVLNAETDGMRSALHDHPSARDLMETALSPFILIGMPHLTPFGLSETWLMKELGHRHWMLLALRLGMADADFRTMDGREAYASICATVLQEGPHGLQVAGANDILEIRSSLSLLSRSQHSSRHVLTIGKNLVCEVELISTFVARRKEGDNHTLARVDQRYGHIPSSGSSELAEAASMMRRRASEPTSGGWLPTSDAPAIVATPDPIQDFNGAGLLYFANFQSIFSRALAPIQHEADRLKRREIFFFGNLRPGEDVRLIEQEPDAGYDFLCQMRRADGKIIASMRARL